MPKNGDVNDDLMSAEVADLGPQVKRRRVSGRKNNAQFLFY